MKTHPFPLTALRLRFECEALTHLQPGGIKAGSNLRGALVSVMRRATCAAHPNAALGAAPGADPEHTQSCPVCWLVAANAHPGEERRGYTLTPPIPLGQALRQGASQPEKMLPPGARFAFQIALFGEAARFLPYFVLAVPEAGRIGMGAGRGQFALRSICAEGPGQEIQEVLCEGENMVRPPQKLITHADLLLQAETSLARQQEETWLEFQTPLRLIVHDKLLKMPDFGAFFGALLKRLDDLSIQHAGGTERPAAEREKLWELANRVRLLESRTEWVEVLSGSSRTGQQTWISGLVGKARYGAPKEIWQALWPWLLWGELTQVGKDTVKGNGVYQIQQPA